MSLPGTSQTSMTSYQVLYSSSSQSKPGGFHETSDVPMLFDVDSDGFVDIVYTQCTVPSDKISILFYLHVGPCSWGWWRNNGGGGVDGYWRPLTSIPTYAGTRSQGAAVLNSDPIFDVENVWATGANELDLGNDGKADLFTFVDASPSRLEYWTTTCENGTRSLTGFPPCSPTCPAGYYNTSSVQCSLCRTSVAINPDRLLTSPPS